MAKENKICPICGFTKEKMDCGQFCICDDDEVMG